MKHSLLSLGCLGLLIAAGCATTGPSPDLIDARRAYEEARLSNAAAYSPDRLLAAKQALDRAEAAHQDDAGSAAEKHLSYVAQRRAELARIYGSYEKDRRDNSLYQATYRQRQDELRKAAERHASQSDASLDSARREIAAQSSELASSQRQLQQAVLSLSKVAEVKEEARGMVITLQGAVLFVTGKSELLPLAKERLTEVAAALKETDDDQPVVVEGYTDSRGADDTNLKLSQARADAVKDFLVSQGVKAEKLRAVGRGEDKPVASNDTPEGRANNRRVEIIVQPKRGDGAGPAANTPQK